MKISELIKQLQKVKKEHGDLRVTTYDVNSLAVIDYRGVRLKNIREKRKREYREYYSYSNDDIDIEKVLHV